jgi:hypothetical protein
MMLESVILTPKAKWEFYAVHGVVHPREHRIQPQNFLSSP